MCDGAATASASTNFTGKFSTGDTLDGGRVAASHNAAEATESREIYIPTCIQRPCRG